jgi:hypothetical protein
MRALLVNTYGKGGICSMVELDDLAKRIATLEDIESIKRLKAKYWRCMDNKLWEELASCFVEDGSLTDEASNSQFRGRQGIAQGVGKALADTITMHQGHNADIEMASETTAMGRWVLHDRILFLDTSTFFRGYGFYEDEYVKENGQWKIKSVRITRQFPARSIMEV